MSAQNQRNRRNPPLAENEEVVVMNEESFDVGDLVDVDRKQGNDGGAATIIAIFPDGNVKIKFVAGGFGTVPRKAIGTMNNNTEGRSSRSRCSIETKENNRPKKRQKQKNKRSNKGVESGSNWRGNDKSKLVGNVVMDDKNRSTVDQKLFPKKNPTSRFVADKGKLMIRKHDASSSKQTQVTPTNEEGELVEANNEVTTTKTQARARNTVSSTTVSKAERTIPRNISIIRRSNTYSPSSSLAILTCAASTSTGSLPTKSTDVLIPKRDDTNNQQRPVPCDAVVFLRRNKTANQQRPVPYTIVSVGTWIEFWGKKKKEKMVWNFVFCSFLLLLLMWMSVWVWMSVLLLLSYSSQ